jgi:hypothetical protein
MPISTPTIRRFARVAAVAGVATAASVLAAPLAGASPGATYSASAAGMQLDCVVAGTPTVFTATGGTYHAVNQMHQDTTGVYHFTGTLNLQSVTATDSTTGTAYQIVGSSWYGGNGTSPATATVRSTDDFNVIGPQGKVADIHASLTFYPDGSVRGVSFGDCTSPA